VSGERCVAHRARARRVQLVPGVCAYCRREERSASGCTALAYADFADGIPRLRIRYGDGHRHDTRDAACGRCHDCGAEPGELHHAFCDWEECPSCGAQSLACDCSIVEATS
jgi:hypothetical protein